MSAFYGAGDWTLGDALDAGDMLELATTTPEWHRDAACKEHPEVNFFPTKDQGAGPAKDVCRVCLTQAACLTWALGQDGRLEGVWGGTTPRERAALRRQCRAA